MLERFNFLNNTAKIFYPLLSLIAILIPMWTVTTIVNGYPFSNAFFNLYEWHGYSMLFIFFYLFALGFIFSGNLVLSKVQVLLLLVLFIFEQIALYFFSSKALFLIASSLFVSIACFFCFTLYKQTNRFRLIFFSFFFFSLLKLGACSLYIFRPKGLHTYKEIIYDFGFLTLSYALLSYVFTKLQKEHPLDSKKSINSIFFSLLLIKTALNQFSYPILHFSLEISLSFILFYYLIINKSYRYLLHQKYALLNMALFLFAFGFIFEALSNYIPSLSHTRASFHLLLTGALSIIVLNIIMHYTLKIAQVERMRIKSFWLIYLFVLSGMLIRFIIPVLWPDLFIDSLHYAMGNWTMAFLIYLLSFTHLLFKSPQKS